METLKQQLLHEAREAGICDEFYNYIETAESISDLLDLLWRGIDFCISRNFPSEKLLNNYRKELNDKGIFFNQNVPSELEFSDVWLKAKSTHSAKIGGYKVAQLYVSDNSRMEVLASGDAFVVIDAFDYASIRVFATDRAKVLVNLYGNSVLSSNSTGVAQIKIVNKQKATY